MLTEIREEIAERLTSAEIKSVIYEGETITPPCAVVVPGQPYLDARSGRDDVPFGHVVVNVDVLLLVTPSPAKTSAKRIDELTERAYAALTEQIEDNDGHLVTYLVKRVSRPGLTPINPLSPKGPRYIGAVISVEEITKEPTA